jgi:hypothetical protein
MSLQREIKSNYKCKIRRYSSTMLKPKIGAIEKITCQEKVLTSLYAKKM